MVAYIKNVNVENVINLIMESILSVLLAIKYEEWVGRHGNLEVKIWGKGVSS